MKIISVLVKREFTTRVKRPAYILTTLIGVLVFVGLSFGPPLLERLSSSLAPQAVELLVLEQPGQARLLPYLRKLGESREGVAIFDGDGLDEIAAYRRVLEEGLTGLLLVDAPLYTLVTPDSSNLVLTEEVKNLVSQAALRWKAAELGLSPAEMASLFQPIDFRLREIAPQGEGGQEVDGAGRTQAMLLAYFLLFMIYVALIMYGNMVATGVAEEKSSRIMEVMVSTVQPFQLMLGKILGIGSLGLLQLVVWLATGLGMAALGQTTWHSLLGAVPLSFLLWFALFFLLGYFFYASIFAAAGALVSRVEEVSQVVTLFMFLIAAGFIAAYVSFLNPNSTLSVAASFIPFTAPMVMFARLVLAGPPLVEVAASVAIMLVSIVLATWVSARIYSIGVLLYGKRPSFRQVVQLWKG